MSSEPIWQVFFSNTWPKTEKDDDTKSWMYNFKTRALTPTVRFLMSNLSNEDKGLLEQRFNNFDIYPNIEVCIISHNGVQMSFDDLNNYFDQLITNLNGKKNHVIATFFGTKLNILLLNLEEKLKIALKKDIIVLLPSGNEGSVKSDIWHDNNIHQLYPNIMWVGAHDEQNDICDFSNRGPLIDIFAAKSYPLIPNQGTSPAMMWVSEAAAYIRAIRSDLSAKEVRLILINSADVNNGFKILNFEKAKKMAMWWK